MVNFVFVVSGTTTGAPPGDYQATGSLWDVIGGGGSGAVENVNGDCASGGGGGAWSQILNVSWSAAQTCQIGAGGAAKNTNNTAGAAGTDTWARIDGAGTAPATTAQGVLAKAGAGGLVGGVVAGGAGGAAASGVGTNKFSGGNGGSVGNSDNSSGAGGGAGGPGGNGGVGGVDTGGGPNVVAGTGGGANGGGANGGGISAPTGTVTTGANGGASITTGNQTGAAGGAGGTANTAGTAGTNGSGGGGGGGSTTTTASGKGGDGGAGKEYDSTHGSGGGGGSGGGNASATGNAGNGGTGGLYGGGGGGTGTSVAGTIPTSGAGGQGLLAIQYNPAGATALSAGLLNPKDQVEALRLGPRSMANTGWQELASKVPVAEVVPKLIQSAIGPSAISSSFTSVSLSFTNIVRSGDGVVGCVAWFSGTGPGNELTGVTDDQGNTYNLRVKINVVGDHVTTQQFDLEGITNFPRTITANFSPAVAYLRLLIEEWSGLIAVDGTPAGALTVNAAVSADTISSTSTTPIFNGDLIWGVTTELKGNQNATASAGSGYTAGTTSVISDIQYMNAENRVQVSAAAISATFTPDQTVTDWATQVIAFKTVNSTGAVTVSAGTLPMLGVG